MTMTMPGDNLREGPFTKTIDFDGGGGDDDDHDNGDNLREGPFRQCNPLIQALRLLSQVCYHSNTMMTMRMITMTMIFNTS